jgi:hypothetical protein
VVNQIRSYVRTALFVDFDNVYSNLNSIDPAAGEAFATEPDRWLRWMQDDMGQVVQDIPEGSGREILVRSCYLNPVAFGRFRPFFMRAAFRVIDCPPLTTRGKNSADIYMVLDILDALQHRTGFDEFILLSADADFTPVMLRLREHDRRTVLLATGPSATALRSACDMVLPLEVFLSEALEMSMEPHVSAAPAGFVGGTGLPRPGLAVASGAAGQLAPVIAESTERLRERMRDQLIAAVAEAQAPVPMAVAAQRIQSQVGDIALQSGWGGYGTFRAFVQTALSDKLQISGPHPPGYLLDPRRHEPLDTEELRAALPDDVADLARRVARITGIPQLPSESYRVLYDEIARLSAGGEVTEALNAVEPQLRDACNRRGVRMTRAAVHFVMQGLNLSGVDWRQPGQDPLRLAHAFADNVVRLCVNARMELTDDEIKRLRSWVTGSDLS